MIDFGCILSTFTPDQEELGKVKRLSDDLIREISKYCQGHNIKAEPILVGSSSRGTSLKGADIDIFIRFHRSYEIREMERLGLQIGHAVLRNGIEKYAEHPYVSSYEFVQKVDIVPCFIINDASEKLTSVDRTPLHNEYLKKHLSDAQKKEVILLKLFLRRQGIYGSELKTNGFSGYVTELLIVNFGSFLSTLNHLSTLKGNLVIGDPNSVKRFESPVIIIDPTDPIRNAGAAVSLTSLSIFKLSSKAFIKNPSEDYFGITVFQFSVNSVIFHVRPPEYLFTFVLFYERQSILNVNGRPPVNFHGRQLIVFQFQQYLHIISNFSNKLFPVNYPETQIFRCPGYG